MAIKAQALADFIAEFMPSLGDATERPNDALEAAEHSLAIPTPLMDASANHQLDYWGVHGKTSKDSAIPREDYMINGTLPIERLESRKLQIKATRYYMWNGILIRRSYIRPHLRCLVLRDDLKVLSSIHEGVCGNHSGCRSLAQKVLNSGYY
ncbi:uncharacterized protein [Pyrus communis]|uniref:uncharacterized protein n=1 Tax=Pyrus communis TaxID=23211 RepID=UPI0035C1740E